MATQEELRLQQIREQGNAEPDPRFMAGPNAVNAPAQGFPPIQDEETFQRIRGITQTRGKDWEQFDGRMTQLRAYREGNPKPQTPQEAFQTDMIDTVPTSSSRLRRAQEKATRTAMQFDDSSVGRQQAKDVFRPQSVEDLPPVDGDSRDGVLAAEEQAGLDTQSGFGENVWQVMHAATEFNSPRARVAFLNQAVRDDIAAKGITIPEGQEVVKVNDNLDEIMFLRPQPNGKLKWTLADSEFMRFSDIGAIADLPTLFSAIGAGLGHTVGKHPFAAEFAGDVVGRTIGNTLEYLMANGEVTAEEFASVRNKGVFESLVDTGISRGLVRAGRFIGNRGALKTGGDPNINVDANIQAAADTMDEVNTLAGGASTLRITGAEASGDTAALQRQKGRETTLSSNAKDAVEAGRIENVAVLGRANDKVAANAQSADSLDYQPYDTVAAVNRTTAETTRVANKKLEEFGKVRVTDFTGSRIEEPGVTHWRYSFEGDASTGLDAGAGVTIKIDANTQEIAVMTAFKGKDMGHGTTPILFDRILQENEHLLASGYTIVSDSTVSRSGERMISRLEKGGFQVVKDPRAVTFGGITNIPDSPGTPVFRITAVPGKTVAAKEVASAQFDRTVVEASLEDMEAVLPAAQTLADDANVLLKGTIGWSEQRQTSKYAVENASTSRLSTTLRRLQNKLQNVLTGTEATEAGRNLAIAIRKEVDEDGETVLGGLAGLELDVGNLINSRERLAKIAASTGDEDVIKLVADIDMLFKKGTIFTEKGNPVADSTRAAINGAIERARTAQGHVDTATASLNASNLFKRSPDGSFVNTSLQAFDRIMANDANFIKHMKPILDESPQLRVEAGTALEALYKERVLTNGYSRAKHNNFLKRYGNAMDAILDPTANNILRTAPVPAGSKGTWRRVLEGAQERAQTVIDIHRAAGREATTTLNAADIVGSFRSMGPREAKRFMGKLNKTDPRLAAQLKSTMVEQTRRDLHDTFFNADINVRSLGTADGFRKWFDNNEGVLKAVHGDQYVTDMRAILNGHLLDARRARVNGNTPATQGDVIRVTRSILGPLSRPQRQITAGNYIRQKALARKVLQIYSDPNKLRQLQTAKGMSASSQAGVAVLTRLGIFEAAGISEEDKDFLPKVKEFYDWINEVEQEGLENAQVE